MWQPTERLCLASEDREKTVWRALSAQIKEIHTKGQEPTLTKISNTGKSDWVRLSLVALDPLVGPSVRAVINEVLSEIHDDLKSAEAFMERADDTAYLRNF